MPPTIHYQQQVFFVFGTCVIFKGQYVSFPGKSVINLGQFVIIFRLVVIYIEIGRAHV